MNPLILVGIGLAGLILVLVFKKQINRYYDNVKGLSESHAKFYKNVAVFLVPVIFILAGGFQYLTVNGDMQEVLMNKFTTNGLNFNIIGGLLLILFGIVTFFLRISAQKYKYFAKLKVMEERYGKNTGNVIHSLSYTIMPIVVGIYWLVR